MSKDIQLQAFIQQMAGIIGLRRRLALNISRTLLDDVTKKHRLVQLFWECTLRCNLSCRHCGSDCKATAGCKDMPLEDFARVLDSVAAAQDPHLVMINVTGGEPLMRQDLEKCGLMMYNKGFPWGMVTNGLALTPERYKRLLQSGLRSMTISLDGIGEDHDWMRGRKGSYDRAIAAIRMVAASKEIVFDVVTCANSRNFSHLGEIKDLLVSCGVERWRIFTVFPVGRGASDPELQLSNEQFRGLMEFIKATRKEGKIKASYGCEGFLGPYEGEVRDHFYFCNAGIGVGGVLCDGSISACTSIRADYKQGNIYTDDFMQVWNTRFQQYRDRSWMHKDECAECKYWNFCRGNGMHLRDENGKLILCHLKRIQEP